MFLRAYIRLYALFNKHVNLIFLLFLEFLNKLDMDSLNPQLSGERGNPDSISIFVRKHIL